MQPLEQVSYDRCNGCPHGFARIVGHRGPTDSPLVVVGESPGIQEVKAGAPFVGPSGRVLEHALAQHPTLQHHTLFCNAIQCYPGTRTKTQEKVTEATHVCQRRLHHLLSLHPRRTILALGNPAVWSTTGNFRSKITQVRGQRFNSGLADHGIVASVHPAFLLRGGGSMRQFMEDVDYACRITTGGDRATKRYTIPEVRVAKTPRDVRQIALGISQYSYCAADTETGGFSGFDFLRDRILCCGFCVSPEKVYVVPEELIQYTGEIFRLAHKTKFIWHNGKFDVKFFWGKGIWDARVDEDTLLLSYAIDETKGIHDLEQLASDILGAPDWKYMIHEYTKGKNKTYADIPRPILHDYMAKDISGTLQVFPFLRQQVRMDPNLETLYTKTLLPQSLYMARIEYKGIRPDLGQIKANKVRLQADADRLESTFQELATPHGYTQINPRSPKQVSPFLYESLALRDRRRPNRIPESTDEDTLRNLTPLNHPAVTTLLAHRKVQKALGTYVNSAEDSVGRDGRVHTSYLIHGTTTGRPSSNDPNLLNIPREPALRSQYAAPPNHMYMEVDINQAELRVLGELSRDKMLYDIYTIPGHPSIHDVTRIDFFGDPNQYTVDDWDRYGARFNTREPKLIIHEQKMRAKGVNFGIVYGRTAESVAEEYLIPVREAAQWIAKWFNKYEGAGRFINACRAAPLRGQNLVTPFGFKRRFQLVSPERAHDMQNQAANFPEQSIAWHLTLHTGLNIQDIARYEYSAYIVNTVYDSILFELPDDRAAAFELGARVLNLLAEVPRRWGLRHIPFKGDIKLGRSWGHLEEEHIPENIVESVHVKYPYGISLKDFTG